MVKDDTRIRKSTVRPQSNNNRKTPRNALNNKNSFIARCPDCGREFKSWADSLASALVYHKTNAKNCNSGHSSSSSSYMGVVDEENTVSIYSEISNVVRKNLEVNDEAEFG